MSPSTSLFYAIDPALFVPVSIERAEQGFIYDEKNFLCLVTKLGYSWSRTSLEGADKFHAYPWQPLSGYVIPVPRCASLVVSLQGQPTKRLRGDAIGKLAVTDAGLALCVALHNRRGDPSYGFTPIVLSPLRHLNETMIEEDYSWFESWGLGWSNSDGTWSELVSSQK